MKNSEEGHGKDILKYNPETGDSEVLVPAWRLIPPGSETPIDIDGYEWSCNGARLLIFTNRTERETGPATGDYWVFDLYVWTWWKLGGDVPPQSLRNATFSPDGSKVSYIMDNNIFGVVYLTNL
ncbi:unnamed protein product [marine sediment metagenome]|uniref:Dipeptidylpeptidase IV N-terminal domain-containing protein n=1 Tax=marine sediment metagenome TaxID=412755 RepID=X1IPF0_9ZZZZ